MEQSKQGARSPGPWVWNHQARAQTPTHHPPPAAPPRVVVPFWIRCLDARSVFTLFVLDLLSDECRRACWWFS